MTPSARAEYATLSREVSMIAARHHTLGLEGVAYLIARAALLLIPDRKRAAELAYSVADDLATAPERRA